MIATNNRAPAGELHAVPRPRIGVVADRRPIVTGAWGITATYLPDSYVRSLDAAGAAPVVLPPIEAYVDDPGLALSFLDGLLLMGGADMDATLYGAEPHPENEPPNRLRDEVELALGRAAIERGLPVLGVCRGFQVMNIIYGGDLEQHLGDRIDPTPHRDVIGVFQRHPVTVRDDTLLGEVLGTGEVVVASHHHQAAGRIGAGLRVSATAPDGTVEALEDPAREFCLSVLWHPEETFTDGGAPLFQALVRHAARRRGVPA